MNRVFCLSTKRSGAMLREIFVKKLPLCSHTSLNMPIILTINIIFSQIKQLFLFIQYFFF